MIAAITRQRMSGPGETYTTWTPGYRKKNDAHAQDLVNRVDREAR
jgi:hypothetical protein